MAMSAASPGKQTRNRSENEMNTKVTTSSPTFYHTTLNTGFEEFYMYDDMTVLTFPISGNQVTEI